MNRAAGYSLFIDADALREPGRSTGDFNCRLKAYLLEYRKLLNELLLIMFGNVYKK